MEAKNALLLYNFIKDNPIRKVLDLGTGIGCSAAVVALALKNKDEKDWKIDGVEQFDKCIKLANELIPEELKQNLTIHKSEHKIWQCEKIPYHYFSIYESLPEDQYDLIINDGPSPILENENYIELPNGTIMQLLLEDKIKTGCYVMFDGRVIAIKVLERFFADNFWLIKHVDRFTIIQRKDTPMVFKDAKLEQMRSLTYFK